MSNGNPDIMGSLRGRCAYVCPECEVEISVERSPRPLAGNTPDNKRRHFAAEIRRQVLWEATCPHCKAWWNDLIDRCEKGIQRSDQERTAA